MAIGIEPFTPAHHPLDLCEKVPRIVGPSIGHHCDEAVEKECRPARIAEQVLEGSRLNLAHSTLKTSSIVDAPPRRLTATVSAYGSGDTIFSW
jgi:hypothetical protein